MITVGFTNDASSLIAPAMLSRTQHSAAGILCLNNHNYSAVEYSRKWFRFHHKLFIAFKSILNYDICICEIKTIVNVKYFACVWFSLWNRCNLLSLRDRGIHKMCLT